MDLYGVNVKMPQGGFHLLRQLPLSLLTTMTLRAICHTVFLTGAVVWACSTSWSR